MTKQTVGKIATDLAQRSPETYDPIAIQREMQKDYMKNLLDAVDRGYFKYKTDFFIHVETKKESLLDNVYRNYFIDRLTCPTPNYDQSVFKYNQKASQIEYIWTIPDRETCHHLRMHVLEVVHDERELLNFVLKFDDGTLFKLMKKFNNEEILTPELKRN